MALFNIKKKAHSDDIEDAQRILSPDSPFAVKEAFKSLNTNILYLPIEDKCKKICITSSFSGEGKTYVSANLALSLADNADSKRVLLIDMDMRKPRVDRLLSKFALTADFNSGLSEYLAGIVEKPEFVKTENSNLDILFSGAESLNPTGLINSSRMKKLFEIAESLYDYIIIDTPPVGIVTDALLLNTSVNGYLIATRADYSNVNALSDTIDLIERVDGTIFGVVLSAIDPKKTKGSLSYKYRSYSKYEK